MRRIQSWKLETKTNQQKEVQIIEFKIWDKQSWKLETHTELESRVKDKRRNLRHRQLETLDTDRVGNLKHKKRYLDTYDKLVVRV